MDDEAPARVGPVTMIGTWTDPAAIEVLEAALPATGHLRPLLERIRVRVGDGRACVGIPLGSRVTDESCDNHARHLFSLLTLLGVKLVPSPMALERVQVDAAELRPLRFAEPPPT